MAEVLPRKYVAVLVHGDVWGAQNANKLVKAVHEQGAQPILIVTRSTLGKDGGPATKIDDLKRPRVLKENVMLDFFAHVDGLPPQAGEGEPRLLTFDTLAKRYCGQEKAYYTTSGGKAGGQQILEIFKKLEQDGKKPEIVLSGDTLALLPPEITDGYDCFGTHPGPLPEIKGMQGTGRSMINRVFYYHDGKRIPEDEIDRALAHGQLHVKGSFFNLATRLDEGPVIDTMLAPIAPGMCLLRVRSELYDALTNSMIEHLPALLDDDQRKQLLARPVAKSAEWHEEIPELEEGPLRKWLGDGVLLPPDGRGKAQIIQNAIIDGREMKRAMADFYPPGRNKAFGQQFHKHFHAGLAELDNKLKTYMSTDMKVMHACKGVHEGTMDAAQERSVGTNPDGSTFPIIERRFSPKTSTTQKG